MGLRTGVFSACRSGIARVMLTIGIAVVFVPPPSSAQENPATAESVASLRKKADAADARAQFELGTRYLYGQGVSRNDAQAAAWYTKAAVQGLADAQNRLGVMYALGQGVTRDLGAALAWYTKAADQGLADAQHNLGDMYRSGHGVPVDSVEALKWFALEEAGAVGDRKTELTAQLTELAQAMALGDIALAQERAREWAERVARVNPAVGRVDLGRLAALRASVASAGAPFGLYRLSSAGVPPRLLHEELPHYTAAAMRARIQGTVLVECVVGIDGTVSKCMVVRSLDSALGLDRMAIEAAHRYTFLPGQKDGQPVPVLIALEFSFALR